MKKWKAVSNFYIKIQKTATIPSKNEKDFHQKLLLSFNHVKSLVCVSV